MALNGIFAVNKPVGKTSRDIVDELQRVLRKSSLFKDHIKLPSAGTGRKARRLASQVKLGHGGTLDPLASGVLVIGVGSGTKRLSEYLNGTKDYETIAVFGARTETYDSEGTIVEKFPFAELSEDRIKAALCNFVGEISQRPPLYSALQMKGRRLYDYARKGIPLPEELKKRSVTCTQLELLAYDTDYKGFLAKEPLPENGEFGTSKGLEPNSEPNEVSLQTDDDMISTGLKRHMVEEHSPSSQSECPVFAATLRMTVSSGFYVRSLIHDLGELLGTGAYMSKLVRTRQGTWILHKNVIEWDDFQNENWESKVADILRNPASQTLKKAPCADTIDEEDP